jgi:hypothetical protein
MTHGSETGKPLLIAIVATATAPLNEFLGAISLSLSIIYTLYKFYKEKNK